MLKNTQIKHKSLMSGSGSFIMKIVFFISCLFYNQLRINGQTNTKAYSFSCVGRPAGYYADLETGCQVYHMCDGLGRQFSYSCPNTTLFQQRMLICDHWYMVNCSISERDYAVNFLIGQKNTPFVNDEEANFRTPRPDLLDKNFLADYNGHLFNPPNKIKTPTKNHIDNIDNKGPQKPLKLINSNGQQHWKISQQNQKVQSTTSQPRNVPQNTRQFNNNNNNNRKKSNQQRQRKPVISAKVDHMESDDLGTSHSTRYNTSSDFESHESLSPIVSKFSTGKKVTNINITVPSRFYQPPFLYPIYNENDTLSTTTRPLTTSTAAPFQLRQTTSRSFKSTTVSPLTFPTTLRGKPFTAAAKSTTQQPKNNIGKFTNNKIPTVTGRDVNKITPAQGFLPSFKPTTNVTSQNVAVPLKILQPPKQELVIHDVASTQGPPVYYEWKDLVNILEPPKLDPPYGTNGREYPESFPDFSGGKDSSSDTKNSLSTSFEKRLQDAKNQRDQRQSGVRSTKSITEEDSRTSNSKTKAVSTEAPLPKDVNELKKIFAIPEFIFPLENTARLGYESENSFNSFQLKIPERHDDTAVSKDDPWYGENPKCPHCHPAFVKSGTCEPCIKR